MNNNILCLYIKNQTENELERTFKDNTELTEKLENEKINNSPKRIVFFYQGIIHTLTGL